MLLLIALYYSINHYWRDGCTPHKIRLVVTRTPGARERESDWIYSLTAEPAEGEQGERASVEGMGCTLDEELLNSPVQYCALFGGA